MVRGAAQFGPPAGQFKVTVQMMGLKFGQPSSLGVSVNSGAAASAPAKAGIRLSLSPEADPICSSTVPGAGAGGVGVSVTALGGVGVGVGGIRPKRTSAAAGSTLMVCPRLFGLPRRRLKGRSWKGAVDMVSLHSSERDLVGSERSGEG